MTARLSCCVPFCRRTTRSDNPSVEWPDDAWICGPHYRAVPAIDKVVRRRARRALRRTPDDAQALARYLRLSRRVTRKALEAAGGLA